ncbi:hypothetical protein BWQ96_09489 [Gracilariopsis chorda]|uniref:Uncharacterized protein n=1 Tax=Gracilariopsis chorda TaxID=448386 RepID=A0A2V3IFA8_9FLOR|nr:hypothetical protein BWQ96_09489 [Gracilariopsis chorda]|eukprot:PXF40779.1 hypothetical protein BWQ96_09489 [Gracilariopsis chorda]
MQILAHNGPNWTRDSLTISATTVAIAVRDTVVLYTHDANFFAQLRATGSSARVSSICFCSAPCLTSLLAVATSDGHVRVFDVEARRIFRVIVDGTKQSRKECNTAVRFLPCSPHRLLVVAHQLSVFELVHSVSLLFHRHLPFVHVHLVEVIPQRSDFVLIAGKDSSHSHSLRVINLYNESDVRVVLTGFPVHDVAIYHQPMQNNRYVMAVVSAKLSYPMFFTSSDGINWEKKPSMKPFIPDDIRTLESYDKQAKPLRSKMLRTAACWDANRTLFTTDPRGTIFAWRIDHDLKMHFLAHRHYAHARQTFTLKSVLDHGVYSTSMDRTLAQWRLTHVAKPFLALQFRDKQFSIVAEACPFGPAQGKRKREEPISYITTPDRLLDETISFRKGLPPCLFVFGRKEGKRGTFSIIDGKVQVCSLENERGATLASLVPSVIPNRKNKKNVLNGFLDDENVTAVCIAPLVGEGVEERPCLFLGSERGALYYLSQGRKVDCLSEALAMSTICRMGYEPVSKVLAVSDSKGVLLSLKVSQDLSDQTAAAEAVFDVHEVCRYDLSSLVHVMQWSEPPVTKNADNPHSTYLLTAMENGKTLVWSSDESGHLKIRAQLREHRGRVNRAVWHENKFMFTAGEDGTIRCWETERLPHL